MDDHSIAQKTVTGFYSGILTVLAEPNKLFFFFIAVHTLGVLNMTWCINIIIYYYAENVYTNVCMYACMYVKGKVLSFPVIT